MNYDVPRPNNDSTDQVDELVDNNIYLNIDDDDVLEWEQQLDVARIIHGCFDKDIDTDPTTNLHRWKGADWGVLLRITQHEIKGYVGFYNCNQLPDGYKLNVKFSITILPLPSAPSDIFIPSEVVSYVYVKTERDSEDRGRALIDANFIRSNVHNFVTPDEYVIVKVRLQALPIPLTNVPFDYNSKRHTDMVGLENLGATCYLNALLQMLYHVNAFRKGVYIIPFAEEIYDESTTLALQNVFNQLQHTQTSTGPVSTKDLTHAFGWDSYEAFQQQDVQEMLRVLLDKLEECMKGTPADGIVKKLFAGKVRSYIRCVNIAYESSREEDFYDIQLDVKGCKDVYESFRKYIAKEMLSGENQYDAGEGRGKQDAEKGVIFTELPPVLTIHLKRFEFDMRRMGFAKIHDRFEFPLRLDLNEFVDSPETKDTTEGEEGLVSNNVFQLHSVLVHAGDVYGGHYYAFIRPTGKDAFWDGVFGKDKSTRGKWYKFDDENVFPADRREAVEMCYGEESGAGFSSAYMLVYIRETEAAQMMSPVEIPRELNLRLEEERMKKVEMMMVQKHIECFVSVNYFLEEDIAMFYEITPDEDFISQRNVRSINFIRGGLHLGLLLAIADELNTSPDMIELWKGTCCSNGVFRVRSVVTFGDLLTPVDDQGAYYFIHVFQEQNDAKLVEQISSIRLKEKEILKTAAQYLQPPQFTLTFDPCEGCGIGKGRIPFKKLQQGYRTELIVMLEDLSREVLGALSESINQSSCTSNVIFFKIFDEDFTLPHSPLIASPTGSDSEACAAAIPLTYIGHVILEENESVSTLHSTGQALLTSAFEHFNLSVPSAWQDVDIVNVMSPLNVKEIDKHSDMYLKDADVECGDIISCLPPTLLHSGDEEDETSVPPVSKLKQYLKFEAYKVLVHIYPHSDFSFSPYFRRNVGLWIQALNNGIPQNDQPVECFFNREAVITLSKDMSCVYVPKAVSKHLRFPDHRRLAVGRTTKMNSEKSMFMSIRQKVSLEKFMNSVSKGKYYLEIGCVPFPISGNSMVRGMEIVLVDHRMRSQREEWLSERIFPQAAQLYLEQWKGRNISDVMDLIPVYRDITWPERITPVPDEFVAHNKIFLHIPKDEALQMSELLQIVRHHICLADEDTGGSPADRDRSEEILRESSIPSTSSTGVLETGIASDGMLQKCTKRRMEGANEHTRDVRPKLDATNNEPEFNSDTNSFESRDYLWFRSIRPSLVPPIGSSEPAIIAFCIWNYQVKSILSPSAQLSTVPESWVEYFSSECASYTTQSLGVQYVTAEEWRFMSGKATVCGGVRIRSIPVAVHSFELYLQLAKPVLSNSGPCLSYIREDDTFESIAHRLSIITGHTNWDTVRLAVVCDQHPPHYILRSQDRSLPADDQIEDVDIADMRNNIGAVVPSPIPNDSSDTSDSENCTNVHRDSHPESVNSVLSTPRSVWDIFTLYYPEYTGEAETDWSRSEMPLPKLGIQRPSVRVGDRGGGNGRGRRLVGGIKIRR